MTDRWKNIMIGAFTLAALAIGASLLLFLKPHFGDGKKTLKVRFANISGINQGTRVTYAGRPIGEVVHIEEIPNARLEAVDETGRVYYYQLLLSIDSKIMVYTSDEIAVCTSGLMGEKSVAILPKAPAADKTLQPITNQIIYANSADPIESTFLHIRRLAVKSEHSLDHLDECFKIFTTDGAQAIANLNQITRDLATGSGTLGRLIAGDDLYLRFNSIMSKSETLMNDINHYGLLFQYNKQWQKTRTKRANLANSLNSPKEFKDFFEEEIDSISTSLGRISEMLSRADQGPERDKILSNDAFKRDFAVLLRQAKALNDALHLFNQDLMTKTDQ